MVDFPVGAPDIPQASVAETLYTMHEELGHVPATNRILQNLQAIATKVGYGSGAPGATAAVLRRLASGQSEWGQVQGTDIATGAILPGSIGGPGAGSANTVLRTTNGVLVALGKVLAPDITPGIITGGAGGHLAAGTILGGVSGAASNIAANTIAGGTAGVNSNLQAGTIATGDLAANAITQSVISAQFSGATGAVAYSDITGSTATLNNMAGGQLIAVAVICLTQSVMPSHAVYFALSLDGAGEGAEVVTVPASGTAQYCMATVQRWTGLTGTHTVKGRWRVSSGPNVATMYSGWLLLLEVKK